MRKLIIVMLILTSSNAFARWEPSHRDGDDTNYSKTKKRGTIALSIVDANGNALGDNYGFVISLQNKKKIIASGSGQLSYELVLPSGTYEAAVFERNSSDTTSDDKPLTIYRRMQILPDTIVHKKLFINHPIESTAMNEMNNQEKLR